jgi:hypothetical protein
MTPFDENTEIWMRELTKKMIVDMLNEGIRDPTVIPVTNAILGASTPMGDKSMDINFET